MMPNFKGSGNMLLGQQTPVNQIIAQNQSPWGGNNSVGNYSYQMNQSNYGQVFG